MEAAARSPRPSGLPGHAHASAQRGSRAPRGAGPRQGAGTWAHHGGAAWGTKPEAAPARRGPPRSGHSSQRQGQSTARGCVSCHSTRVLACCRPALLAALTAWAGGAGRARGVPTEAVSTEACVFSAQRPAPAHASRPQQGARTAHGLDSQGRSGGSVEGELMFSCSGNHGDRGGASLLQQADRTWNQRAETQGSCGSERACAVLGSLPRSAPPSPWTPRASASSAQQDKDGISPRSPS